MEFTKRKRYVFNNNAARRIIIISMYFVTIKSLVSAIRLLSLIWSSLFKELDIPINHEQIENVTQSHSTIQNIMVEMAADVLAISRAENKNKVLFLSTDAANKNVTFHVVKIIACWHVDEDRLFLFTLDADACDSTNICSAQVVDHYL